MLFSDWIKAVLALLDMSQTLTDPTSATPTGESDFNAVYPQAISFAENKIQRDLDLVATRKTSSSPAITLTANSRFFPVNQATGVTWLVVEQLQPVVGGVRRQSCILVSRPFLDTSFPGDFPPFAPSVPRYMAWYDDQNLLVGPPPDQPYPAEVVGTARLTPMSAANPAGNFLNQQMPDLYVAASMIFLSGYQRDFGMQADDPRMALSWDKLYQDLKTPALVEEARRKWIAEGWTPQLPVPVPKTPRT